MRFTRGQVTLLCLAFFLAGVEACLLPVLLAHERTVSAIACGLTLVSALLVAWSMLRSAR